MWGLTRQEKQVLLFLLSVAFVGAGINFLVKTNSFAKGINVLSPDIAKINLNTADKELLMSVPGIGEKLASRIIAFRKEKGGFKELNELRRLKGMNAWRYEKIKNFIFI